MCVILLYPILWTKIIMQSEDFGKGPDHEPDSMPLNRGAPSVSTSDIMLVQETLQVQGLYNGEIDGIPGTGTMRGVRAYKKNNKLPVNNTLDSDFVNLLRDTL